MAGPTTVPVTGGADISGHLADPDPHTVYQLESAKGQASGYASLDSSVKVPIAEVYGNPLSVEVLDNGDTPTFTAVVGKMYLCENTSALTITLPALSGVGAQDVICVKRRGTGTVTLDANSTETIDGATTHDLPAQYSARTVVKATSTDWAVV